MSSIYVLCHTYMRPNCSGIALCVIYYKSSNQAIIAVVPATKFLLIPTYSHHEKKLIHISVFDALKDERNG